MLGLEREILADRPLLVIVYGDVNSTLAGSLAAAKLRVPTAHVEAGLRSFDLSMPEEINRMVSDLLADLLFTTSPEATDHLTAMGVDQRRIHFVGNTMIDTLLAYRPRFESRVERERLGITGDFGVVTLHRPSNVDGDAGARPIVEALHGVAAMLPLVIPLHPRGRANLEDAGLTDSPRLRIIEPLGYLSFLSLVADSRLVLTDSGGIQEETTILDVPCLTIRPNTERPITISHGTNRLVSPTGIVGAARESLAGPARPGGPRPPLWDGKPASASRTLSPLGWSSGPKRGWRRSESVDRRIVFSDAKHGRATDEALSDLAARSGDPCGSRDVDDHPALRDGGWSRSCRRCCTHPRRAAGSRGPAPAIRRVLDLPSANLLAGLGLSLVMLVADPATAEKLLQIAYVVVIPLAMLYAIQSVRKGSDWLALLAIPLTFTFAFQYGFYDFSFGVALFLVAGGYAWRHRVTPRARQGVVFGVLALLLYLTHLVPFLQLLVFLTVVGLVRLIWCWQAGGPRSALASALATVPIALGVLPSALLAAIFLVSTRSAAPAEYLNPVLQAIGVGSLALGLVTTHPLEIAVAVGLALTLAMLVLAVAWRRTRRGGRTAGIPVA